MDPAYHIRSPEPQSLAFLVILWRRAPEPCLFMSCKR